MVDVVFDEFQQLDEREVCFGVGCLDHADDSGIVQQTAEVGTARRNLTLDAFGAKCVRTWCEDARVAWSFDGLECFEAAGTVERTRGGRGAGGDACSAGGCGGGTVNLGRHIAVAGTERGA
jgi:hypothetical protein